MSIYQLKNRQTRAQARALVGVKRLVGHGCGAFIRAAKLRFALIGVAALVAALAVLSTGGTAATLTNFSTGTLIIPMDTDSAGNHATYNQNNSMWKAYGLVYKLLQSGIPVQWAISPTKASTSDIDVSVSSVKDKRTGTSLSSWDYRGGPFIVDSAHVSQAMPIISAWWSANGNQPNIHEAQVGFQGNIQMVLTTAPRIANEAVNVGVTTAYYNAAGIPDSNGNPWSSTSPNVLTETQIANGGLFDQGAACAQPKYDIFVTPHNSGYSYSLTDPTNLGTKTYAQLDTFVQKGGGWTALCHSILSNENAIAQLTTNGTANVKALFKTSQPGGVPGGFLTTTGFSSIDNTGGAWSVLSPGVPTAQAVPTSVANSLPGGSVQTWPAPGNAGAPTYYANTSRVATFTASGVSHDHIITGVYHNGTGAGRLTYIGGHSFGTTLPYSSNPEAPYLRDFYNSLLFNGGGTAKLDLSLNPSSYPQNGTGLLTVSIKNIGATTAQNVANAGITLASGFTYAGTVSGPAPTVSGQTLVWGNLGDVAGGATPVTFHVSVNSSVSGTTGSKQLGTLSATFTDDFGGTFTAGVCKDVTIAPVPVPSLSKTPSSQGPAGPGDLVTWTLTYGNVGGGALQSGVVQDTLPPGFVYVSSSSSPSLGAPTVIPGTRTIVRWTPGTVAANTASAGTITITARAGAVTSGTGTPPHQTFTNDATLTGSDGGGQSYVASASATVDVQAIDISLGKTVDNTFISTLPGSATYTMSPHSDDDSPLSNARVIDPLPAGIVSAPTVGQGGSYGAYSPIAAVGGDDGTGLLTTAITVSSNLVTTGTAVTVTLNVKSTSAISGVSPGAMTATGGAYTCGDASPASANVPMGGAGVNFTFSCTTDGLGEYVFSDDADDGGANNWPAATSASVLSVAGGGSNVALWNLGSNTNAVPGQTVTSGYTSGIYGLRGAGTTTFQKFDTSQSSWSTKAATSAAVSLGGALTTDGAGTIYALGGNGTQAFYAYTASSDTWASKALTGTNVKDGGSLVFLNVGGTKYVFATMGNNAKTFKRYDVTSNSWTSMALVPVNVKGGASLSTDGASIYLVLGSNTKLFYKYDVGSNTWATLASLSQNVSSGGASVHLGGYVYVLRGKTTNGFYRYSVAGNTWSTLASAPATVTFGGALTTDGTNLYAFQGGTTAFWRYDVSTNKWTTLPSFTAATGAGGSLVYMTGVNPQGRFSSIDVTSSLGVTGDTVDITLSLTSSASVNSIGAGSLTVTPTNGASCSTLTGPTLTSADSTSSSTNDPVTYKWTCTLSAGASPGSLTFSDTTVTGSGPVSFPGATSMSVLVSPPLTMQVTVPNGAPNPVQDTSLLLTDQATAASPTVSTWSGPPAFTITKTTSPSAATTLHPGDPITYTMTVQNSGTGTATNVTVSDTIPSQTTYISCSGGASCSNTSGTVTWNVGSLAPGDTSTVTLTVATRTDLAVSDTDYTVSNSASVTSTEVPTPTTSNTVTNTLEVKPEVVKLASTGTAGNGDTVTYTVQVSNPGAAFTGDVTDPIPAGASFAGTGSCSPSCSFAGGTVTWSSATIQPGTNTFTFDATITATGGSTVTNSATLDPTSPNLAAIPSNSVDTEIGPELAVVKLGNRAGLVATGDVITYTLVVSNESRVAATGATVTDPLPAGTSYVTASCTTPVGNCSFANGEVSWTLGSIAANTSLSLTFQLHVGTGTTQVSNLASVAATNSPTPVDSNYVNNAVTTYPLTVTIGAGQGTVTADTGGISCSDLGGTCSGIYGSGTIVTLTAAGRNGQQFTGWSGDCSGSTPSCQLTMDQARNATASFATPPAAPDLVLVKTHTGDFAQGGTGSYTLTASNIGGTQTSGSVGVVDNPPTGLTVTGISGTGWTCDVPSATCSRSDALAAGAAYEAITVTVSVAANAAATVTNHATVSGGGETNTGNDSASDLTTVTPHLTWPLTVSVTGSGSVSADSGAISSCTSSGGVCTDTYDDGTVVTLTATPAAHYNFSGWSGACTGTSTCQVTMNQARNVTATFTVFQPDLTIAKSHSGNFTQAGSGSYSLLVSNGGADPTFGTVSATDNPPAGLTVTAISGTGWTCDIPSATCTRSDALAAGASYPAITVTVSVAGNTAASVTNHATVSGGGDQNAANNTASDPTTITPQQFPLTVTVTGSGSVTANSGAISGCTSAGGVCSDSYDNGTLVTLAATPAAHYNFSGWSGACTGTSTCQVTMSQARNVTATFTVFQPDLTIAKSHTGNFTQAATGSYSLIVSNLGVDPSFGTASATDNPPTGLTVTGISGSGWTCDLPSATCTRSDALAAGASYPAITVTVAVAGNAAASLTNHATVAGGGDQNAANNTASDPTTISPQQFPLTVTVTGSGSVTANSGAIIGCTSSSGVCSDSYDNGTVLTLTATPAAHYNFTGWGGACSGTGSCQVTMNQARNVTATFTVYQPDLMIAKSHTGSLAQGGSGSYSLLVSNLGADPTYAPVSATDNPPTGLTVTGISGTGWTCDVPSATCTRSDALAAGAGYPAITVTVSVAGNAAASVTNHATVSGGGETNTGNDSAGDPTTITPYQTWPLTVSVTGSGSVSADGGAVSSCTSSGGTCTDNYNDGTVVTLTATPDAHHNFSGWTAACTGTTTTCQVTMSQARNVSATFEPANTTLIVHVEGSGAATTVGGPTCTATCATPHAFGTSVQLSASPVAGWWFVGWSGNCNGTQGACAVQMTEDRAVTATFVRNPQELRVEITGSGSGRVEIAPRGVRCSRDCDESYDEGQVVKLVATPSKTSILESIKGCVRVEGSRCTVTMDKARKVVVSFVEAPTVKVLVPSRLVFHTPHDHAVVKAHAEFDGHAVRGVAIRATFRCPGERKALYRGVTDANGNIHFTEARRMANAVRILECVATATARIAGHRTHDTGIVRFIHPYWLKVASQAADGSHVVIAAFGRPGSVFDVRLNGEVVARAKIGKSAWVEVPLPTARPGDVVELGGVGDHHFSHAISLGTTPGRAIVH